MHCDSPVSGYDGHLELILPKEGQTRLDTKAKKRIEVLRKRQDQLQLRLQGAKSQMDDPDEVAGIEKEIAAVKAEIEKLKNS